MPIIYNDRPATLADLLSPTTSPTLKLARIGGGTIGGPTKVYTSNPFSFIHKGGDITVVPTVLQSNRYGQPEHAMLDEIRAYRYNVDLSARTPSAGGAIGPGGRTGQFVWPDTSIGGLAPVPRMTAEPYSAESANVVERPPTFWQKLVGLVGPRGK